MEGNDDDVQEEVSPPVTQARQSSSQHDVVSVRISLLSLSQGMYWGFHKTIFTDYRQLKNVSWMKCGNALLEVGKN